MRDILSFCPLSLKEAGFLSPREETPFSCLARRVSSMSLLLCPGTLVTRLTLIGVFLSPACPCTPAIWSDTCQLPRALLLEHLLHPHAPR